MGSHSPKPLPAQTPPGNGRSPVDASASQAQTPAEGEALVDLNTADTEALRQLRGIGPALAERILQYRLANGGFAKPDELLRVPGITPATYAVNHHRLTASPLPLVSTAAGEAAEGPGTAEPLEAPTAAPTAAIPALPEPSTPEVSPTPTTSAEWLGEAAASPVMLAGAPQSQSSADSAPVDQPVIDQSDVPGPAPAVPPMAAPGTVPVTAAAAPMSQPERAAEPPQLPANVPAAAPPPDPPRSVFAPVTPESRATAVAQASAPLAAPAAQSARRDWTGLMAMSLLGAFLGAVLALLAVAGLNGGTLQLNERQDVLALSAALGQAQDRAAALETETEALRARLVALEGLSNRVGAVEAEVSQASAALDSLEAETAALDERATTVENQVGIIRTAVERFDTFLAGLRALLAEALPEGAPGPAPTATPGTAATATATAVLPTRTPAATGGPTRTPAAATRTPAPTRTP